MITLDSSQLVHWISQFFWPMVRILALIATAPVLSERAISKRVKIGLAAMITWLLVPLLPPVNVTLFSPAGFMLLIQQMLIGIAIGFTMQFAFAAVRAAGELIGLQMGLSFATFLIPPVGLICRSLRVFSTCWPCYCFYPSTVICGLSHCWRTVFIHFL